MAAYPGIAHGTQVTIRALNVAAAQGVVRVALCRESEWSTHNCSYGAQEQATLGIVEVSLQVPPGLYGVLVHHDSNNDGRVNKNLVGLPVEGVGFSRDAKIRFGFPTFSAVSVPVNGTATAVDVSLLFEPKPERK